MSANEYERAIEILDELALAQRRKCYAAAIRYAAAYLRHNRGTR